MVKLLFVEDFGKEIWAQIFVLFFKRLTIGSYWSPAPVNFDGEPLIAHEIKLVN
jgi:hypothetical protein